MMELAGKTMKRYLISALMFVAATGIAADTNEVIKLDEKTTIDSYSQGKITIGGKLIRSDILILPDGTVQQDWSTKTSHVLTEEDIRGLLALKAGTLIIGTGNQGLMKPAPALKKSLKEAGVDVIILKTPEAIKKLKELRGEGKNVSACFHIGC
jgi:hypothetical protein